MMLPRLATAVVTAEHQDQSGGSLATSANGICALVSRRTIALYRNDNLSTIDTIIKRDTKWDTCYAEFSETEPSYLAITNAQAIQIFNTADTTSNTEMCSVRGHTRSITDLNWSHQDKCLLATASYDNYIHVWDLREPRKAVNTMYSIAGAFQIKWCKEDDNFLSTAHEGDVRIWDRRKSNSPVHYITAHLSKVNSVDWSPFKRSRFATCSQDGNIKFFDISTYKGKPEMICTAGLPVWKVRFTPFGNGFFTALAPQLRRTGEYNALYLYNLHSMEQPVYMLAGHSDVLLDFGCHSSVYDLDYDLITWAKDCTLRLWKVNSAMFSPNVDPLNIQTDGNLNESCSDSDSAHQSNFELSRSSNPPSPASSRFDLNRNEFEDMDFKSDNIILSLEQEFSLFNQNIPNIIIEELSVSKRQCIVAPKSLVSCRLKISFPNQYPRNVIPQFVFLNENDPTKRLSDQMKKEIIKVLQNTASQQIKRQRACLEKCLRQFIQTFEKLTANQQSLVPPKPHTTLLDLLPSHKYGSYLDASVPFPRTSGARFCSSEILVCFGRPPHLEQMNVPTEYTPRSLSALSAYLTTHVRAYNSTYNPNPKDNRDVIPSISSFYIDSSRKRRFRNRSQQEKASPKNKTPNLCGPVSVFSVAKLLPISRPLAEQYLLSCQGGIINLCEMNAKIATTSGRRDLFQAWYLVRLSAEIYLKNQLRQKDMFQTPWSEHPFGRKMIQSMIEHYALKCNDIQMAAMIACAFSGKPTPPPDWFPKSDLNFDNSTLSNGSLNGSQGIGPRSTPESIDEWGIINSREIRRTRSNSWSEYCESNEVQSEPIVPCIEMQANIGEECDSSDIESIFDPGLALQYDYYKKIYADILYRWKLIKKRAQLLKTVHTEFLLTSENQQSVVNFVSECQTEGCKDKSKMCTSYKCSQCDRISLTCTICRLPVKGTTNHCIKCGHGGHTIHMQEWFQSQIYCPSGCGCKCLEPL